MELPIYFLKAFFALCSVTSSTVTLSLAVLVSPWLRGHIVAYVSSWDKLAPIHPSWEPSALHLPGLEILLHESVLLSSFRPLLKTHDLHETWHSVSEKRNLWAQTDRSTCTSCMTLGKSPNLSSSQFPDMSVEVDAPPSQGEGEDNVK